MQLFPHDVPTEYIERGKVRQIDIIESNFENGHFKVSLLILFPDSKIAEHRHTDELEYYFNLRDLSLSLCSIDESHSLENTSETDELRVISVKISKKIKTSEES